MTTIDLPRRRIRAAGVGAGRLAGGFLAGRGHTDEPGAVPALTSAPPGTVSTSVPFLPTLARRFARRFLNQDKVGHGTSSYAPALCTVYDALGRCGYACQVVLQAESGVPAPHANMVVHWTIRSKGQ